MTPSATLQLTGIAVLFGIVLAITAVIDGPRLLKYGALLDRGQNGVARIERLYDTHSRSKTIHHVRYAYVYETIRYVEEDVLADAEYRKYTVGQEIPITLTPEQPARSLVTPEGATTLKSQNQEEMSEALKWVAGILVIDILLSCIVLVPYFNQKSLLKWGTLIQARIVYQGKHTFRGRDYLTVRYEFDYANKILSGERNSIDPNDWQLHARMQVRPVVLYDPKKPSRNGLFPFTLAELCAERSV